MIKKISYFSLAFILCFLCLSYPVSAKVVYNTGSESTSYDYDFLSDLSNFLSDEEVIKINDYLENFDSSVFDIKTCYTRPNYVNDDKIVFTCYSDYPYYYRVYFSYFDAFFSEKPYYLWITYKDGVFTYNTFTSSYNSTYIGLLTNTKDPMSSDTSFLFYSRDDRLYTMPDVSSYVEYYIEDEIYATMSDNLKKYYNFQNYLVIDSPIYSFVNLRLGNYEGPAVDAEYTINYYYDDVLQEDLTETKRDLIDKLIVLEDLDEVVDDIYFLDKTRVYRITLKPYEENVINVYYYSVDMNYNVNIYLDDIYYQSHSFVGVAKLGSEVVLEDLLETINIYTLDNREYKLSVNENPQLNYINVYYYSDNYDTKYQDIDTSDKFYISFDWVYIKELFELKGNYTQTEQFLIVYCVNILFYVIVGLFIYIGLKMLNKLFSFIRMF